MALDLHAAVCNARDAQELARNMACEVARQFGFDPSGLQVFVLLPLVRWDITDHGLMTQARGYSPWERAQIEDGPKEIDAFTAIRAIHDGASTLFVFYTANRGTYEVPVQKPRG